MAVSIVSNRLESSGRVIRKTSGVELFFLVELLGAFTALGIVLSLFAQNEFQAIQFIPVVITPQVVLGGTFPQWSGWTVRTVVTVYRDDRT